MKGLLNLENSILRLEGTSSEREDWSKKVARYIEDLTSDRSERKQIYQKRKDFYEGNQGGYSNITGIIKDTKQKKGHTNQVANYAGKTVVKIAYGLANNPPKISTAAIDETDEMETIKAQAVEDYINSVLDSPLNYFWKKTYRRACVIQCEFGDAAIKTYIEGNQIKISNHDDMNSIMVGWNGEGGPDGFDFVITESFLTPDFIEENWKIKVERTKIPDQKREQTTVTGTWSRDESNVWATKNLTAGNKLPRGKTDLTKLKVIEFDSANYYITEIEGEVVQFIEKDDISYPKVKFWTIIPNIPNPPNNWSIADIDYLIDIQIELNDNDNRASDYIRVGGVQRYIAYNMDDFDPESIKTSSGQVIFVSDPDGKSRFEPLPTNINNFPSDSYNQRKLNQNYDMGLPKVSFGGGAGESGRSKAIDYQSSVDLIVFKRDAWELAIQDIAKKIQIFGNFLLNNMDWFSDNQKNFVIRRQEFDWSDILPITQSDKVVNVLNKFTMGLPLKQAYKELGYRNPDALLEQLKQELKDPNMMILRAKAWQMSEGLLQAQLKAQETIAQTQTGEFSPSPNQEFPTLTTGQNEPTRKPVAQRGGTTTYSSAKGLLDRTRQNLQAQGR